MLNWQEKLLEQMFALDNALDGKNFHGHESILTAGKLVNNRVYTKRPFSLACV